MKLVLAKNNKIKEVKTQFSRYFPHLKLEFFDRQHGPGEGSTFDRKLGDSTVLAAIAPPAAPLVFEFSPSTTVAEFEQRMQQEQGLPVQVFRKAGSIWLETVQTDNLSLEKQNEMGQRASRPASFNVYTLFL